MNIIQVTYAIIMLSLSSCFKEYNLNKEFVRKYKDENFDAFINTSFLVRSMDAEGNLIIFINTDFKNAYNQGPYIVTVEKDKGQIKNTSSKLMKDSTNFNKEIVHRLTFKFLEYNIYSLAVDENRNVYIRIREAERPTLIHFSDSRFINEDFKKNWKIIEGNWYEREK